jgi:phenylacetic acid degradation operon negative regulatory protein
MDDLGIRPLNARSLVLSVLLGLPTPTLPASSTAGLAELFGIAPGTMRTAVSRMLAAGELRPVKDGYELAGPLVERKAAQDIGRRPAGDAWDGTWWVVTATRASRQLATRRDFRTAMANARMGELRPDTWMRPANLAGPRVQAGTIVVRGPVDGEDGRTLAGRLWDLDGIARRCAALLRAVDRDIDQLAGGAPDAVTRGIMLAAAVVHFLRAEPLLPRALTPDGWATDDLRDRYAAFDREVGRVLRQALDQPPDP